MIPDPRDILLAPVVSEKSYGLLEERQYTFIVRPDANNFTKRIEKIRFAVGRESHHFVFVAVMRESEILSERRIKDA